MAAFRFYRFCSSTISGLPRQTEPFSIARKVLDFEFFECSLKPVAFAILPKGDQTGLEGYTTDSGYVVVQRVPFVEIWNAERVMTEEVDVERFGGHPERDEAVTAKSREIDHLLVVVFVRILRLGGIRMVRRVCYDTYKPWSPGHCIESSY